MKKDFTIAIIEDHDSLREMMTNYFKQENYKVFSGSMGEELDNFFKKNRADLLILDLNLPGEDGISIAKRYRQVYPSINIIILTVRKESKDKILGYGTGADLYLEKPVSLEELNAAVLSIKRRVNQEDLNKENPKLNMKTRQLTFKNLKTQLGTQEAIVLKKFIDSPENIIEYWEILELLKKELTEKNKTAIVVYIHRLNKKLDEVGIENPAIQSLWKKGYQLTKKIIIS
jgi:two-component system phosphate regulon response regulator OmpR